MAPLRYRQSSTLDLDNDEFEDPTASPSDQILTSAAEPPKKTRREGMLKCPKCNAFFFQSKFDEHKKVHLEEAPPPGGKRKSNLIGGKDREIKRRRNTKQNSNCLDTLSDAYCWICHKEGVVIGCETCPRVFHLKCIQHIC